MEQAQQAAEADGLREELAAANSTVVRLTEALAEMNATVVEMRGTIDAMNRTIQEASLGGASGEEEGGDGLCSAAPSEEGGGSCGLTPPGAGASSSVGAAGSSSVGGGAPSKLSAVMSLTLDTFASQTDVPGTALFVKFFAPWCTPSTHLTQCTNQLILENQLPHITINLLF